MSSGESLRFVERRVGDSTSAESALVFYTFVDDSVGALSRYGVVEPRSCCRRPSLWRRQVVRWLAKESKDFHALALWAVDFG